MTSDHSLLRGAAPLLTCRHIPLVTFFVITVCWLSTPRYINAQNSSLSRYKDSQGTLVVQSSLGRMGISPSTVQQATSISVGTVSVGNKQFPVTIKTSGTALMRVEIQKPAGLGIYILNSGRGELREPDGTIKELTQNNTLAQRISHIPALSLMGDVALPQVEVGPPAWINNKGASLVTVKLDLVPDSATSGEIDLYRRITTTTFKIDAATNLISEMDFTQFNENSAGEGLPAKIMYSDYRNVNGIMVPFRQDSYFDGQLESTLVLDSVQFNVSVDPAEFALTEEVSNVQ